MNDKIFLAVTKGLMSKDTYFENRLKNFKCLKNIRQIFRYNKKQSQWFLIYNFSRLTATYVENIK